MYKGMEEELYGRKKFCRKTVVVAALGNSYVMWRLIFIF